MKIVVMGCGKLGSNLAESLISDGHDVTLIETDINKCKIGADELDTVVIHGNGTNFHILEEAEIENVDVFVAATGNDATNFMASAIVRDYKVPKIVARIVDPQHEKVFHEAGINNLVIPEKLILDHVKRIISS